MLYVDLNCCVDEASVFVKVIVNDSLFIFVVVSRSLYPGLEPRFLLDTIKTSVMESLKKAAKTRGRVTLFFYFGSVYLNL